MLITLILTPATPWTASWRAWGLILFGIFLLARLKSWSGDFVVNYPYPDPSDPMKAYLKFLQIFDKKAGNFLFMYNRVTYYRLMKYIKMQNNIFYYTEYSKELSLYERVKRMHKVNLVLADYDELYLDRLVEFINLTYPNRLKVVSFTKEDLLRDFLTNTVHDINILFAHRDFIQQDVLGLRKVDLVITLSDGSLGMDTGEQSVINKYQPGERLVSQLLEVYSQKNSQAAKVVLGTNATKVVSVYSPIGGAGKTTITLALAAKLSELGQKVFCLSLESLNSLGRIMASQGNDALTYILLSLKEAKSTFPIKVEALKTNNPSYKFDFFEPAECFLELSEIDSGLIGDLVNQLRALGKYDVILIDTDTLADERAMEIFRASDKIVFLKTLDPIGRIKSEEFINQLLRIGLGTQLGLDHKLVMVTNKIGERDLAEGKQSFENSHFIPLIPNLWLAEKEQVYFDVHGELKCQITKLASSI